MSGEQALPTAENLTNSSDGTSNTLVFKLVHMYVYMLHCVCDLAQPMQLSHCMHVHVHVYTPQLRMQSK